MEHKFTGLTTLTLITVLLALLTIDVQPSFAYDDTTFNSYNCDAGTECITLVTEDGFVTIPLDRVADSTNVPAGQPNYANHNNYADETGVHEIWGETIGVDYYFLPVRISTETHITDFTPHEWYPKK